MYLKITKSAVISHSPIIPAFSNMVVPKEYCGKEIGDNTSLALLLPTMKGEGICSTGLIHFLVKQHNDFIEEYARLRHHK